jgi:hypothetical protein
VALIARDRELLQLMQRHLSTTQWPERFILIDECIFSAKTFKPMAWATKRRNVTQRKQMGSQKAVAVVAAVSPAQGLILFREEAIVLQGATLQ